MPLRALIFDMDGTIGDTLYCCVEGLRRAAEPLSGKRYSDEEIWATFGPSEESCVKLLAPNASDQCLDDYIRHYEELHQTVTEPFDGLREMLSDLKKKGLKLGLVTGKGPRTLEVSMRVMNLNGYFDEVRWGCPHGACKPEKIRELVDLWGFPGDEVGYVGDVVHDITSSRQAGVKAISVAWAPEAKADALRAAGPDALFTTVSDFTSWVNEQLSSVA